MAFSGIIFTCASTGAAHNPPYLLDRLIWSETHPGAGRAINVCPLENMAFTSAYVFEVYSSVDAFVAWGPEPDAQNGPRAFCKAGRTYDFVAQGGDKIEWFPA